MKQIYKSVVTAALVLFVSFFSACGGGSSGGKNANKNTKSGASFQAGNETIVAIRTITDAGSTLEITDTGTHLDGAKIIFPAGALPADTEVKVGLNDGTVQLPQGSRSPAPPQTITLHTGETTHFNQLVEITLPYNDDAHIPTPFYIDEANQLRPVTVTRIDTDKKTFSFVTAHASTWTWVKDIVSDTPDEDTGFRPSDDGFQITNHGSTINSGGESFGMTTFAQWYFAKKLNTHGIFFPKYMAQVGSDAEGTNLTGQDVIATRAHSAANQSWNYSEFILPNITTSDEYRFNTIVHALKVTKRPVNLSLRKIDANGAFISGHAVLAYGVNETDGEISIYDPNFPKEPRSISYNTETKAFQSYESETHTFKKFFLNGTGSYSLSESYLNIFEDAEHNFTSDNHPVITITSHENGQTVSTRNITLQGVVESSEILISKIDILVGDEKFATPVDSDGNFSVGVSLNTGIQRLRFVTRGQDGREVTPNNFDANPFTINVDLDKSVMLVTLTWDKDATDLDLYVIDPQGDCSYYHHKNTADGGELDYDIQTGYGPEHWTLSTEDTIRWGEEAYRVRVHYFTDNGNGGTNYTLSVKLYEGTEREVVYLQNGYLSHNNSQNDKPTDTGADWADFNIPVVLTNPSRAALSYEPHVKAKGATPVPIKLTVEIPDKETRHASK
ncbi:MAG: hypothetical protein MI742_17275 [Desulfobacterales bacterium]|nr:hypothetical protein [Desulfobacterales bacterium]